jgi:hypothetical protein
MCPCQEQGARCAVTQCLPQLNVPTQHNSFAKLATCWSALGELAHSPCRFECTVKHLPAATLGARWTRWVSESHRACILTPCAQAATAAAAAAAAAAAGAAAAAAAADKPLTATTGEVAYQQWLATAAQP